MPYLNLILSANRAREIPRARANPFTLIKDKLRGCRLIAG